MTRPPDFRELVGDDVSTEEQERLERVHDLLVQAGPPPELSPALAEPRTDPVRENVSFLPRRRLGAALSLAAALALVAFLGGYLAGYRHQGFAATFTRSMHASAGTDPRASADIRLGTRDAQGNLPLELVVRNLKPLPNGGYYEMYLTRGQAQFTCGTFAGGASKGRYRMTVPYEFHRGDGWIVVAEHPGRRSQRVVLTT
jgi:hypothetical protein